MLGPKTAAMGRNNQTTAGPVGKARPEEKLSPIRRGKEKKGKKSWNE